MPQSPDRLDSNAYALEAVDVLSGRYVDAPPADLGALRARLPLALDRVGCKGKFLYFALAGDASLWSTLGMTGGWTLRPAPRHARLALRFRRTGGAGADDAPALVYYDARNFGTFRVCFDGAALDAKLARLGLSWLEDAAAPDFGARFESIVAAAVRRAPARPLAVFLMDQTATAGIGNYLLSEVLHASRTDPFAAIGDVGAGRWAAIRGAALRLCAASRDAQLDSDPRPSLRAMAPRFELAVYGRARDASGNAVRRATGPHGRTVHWVPGRATGPDAAEAGAAAAARAAADATPSLGWTAARLRDACRARGLKVSGTKPVLLRRLLAEPEAVDTT